MPALDNGIDVNADDNAWKSDEDAVQEAIDHLDELEYYRPARGKHPRRRLTDHGHLDTKVLLVHPRYDGRKTAASGSKAKNAAA